MKNRPTVRNPLPDAPLRAILCTVPNPEQPAEETTVAAARKRVMQINDLFRFNRAADPQISPDGKHVAYVLTTVDLAGNSTRSSIWLAPTAVDAEPLPLTVTTKKDRHPRWSPDGKQILFESNRSGDFQLWSIAIDGGEARKLTSISTEASHGIWSPDGKWIAFLSTVYPEYSSRPFGEADALNKKRKEEIEKRPVKARVFTRMFYRHWDEWVEDKRKHLFVMPAGGGEPRNVTPGDRDAYPTSSTFSVGDDFTFTPDSKALVYTAGAEENEAWNTNFDLCRVPIAGGKVKCLTSANKAADGSPRFSPDGKLLAYRAQARAGFEADRWQLMIAETDGSSEFSVTAEFDSSVDNITWAPDGSGIYFTAEDKGVISIFAYVSKTGKVRKVLHGGCHAALSISRDGKLLAFTRSRLQHPDEVLVCDMAAQCVPKNDPRNLSRANTEHLADLDLPRPESITVPGAGGTPMQMWLLKPPGFDAKKKWPLAFIVHGGPQGAWHDGWSFRWCPELWAAQGYVVALPNPRGSTGFRPAIRR